MPSARSPRPVTFSSVRRRLERWRGSRSRGRRIPPELWSAAAELAREQGISRTARELGLGYDALKKHAEAVEVPEAASTMEFVEVPLGVLGSAPECVLELEDGHGARLRVELKGPATSEVEAVARALWSGSR